MSISDKQKEINYAKENGYHRLGSQEIEVEYPLTETEKVELGKSQSESLCEIENLEAEFDKIKREYKNKIEVHELMVTRSSHVLKRGTKTVFEKLPCFFDPRTHKKHFVNLKTGEIIESREATQQDLQSDFLED